MHKGSVICLVVMSVLLARPALISAQPAPAQPPPKPAPAKPPPAKPPPDVPEPGAEEQPPAPDEEEETLPEPDLAPPPTRPRAPAGTEFDLQPTPGGAGPGAVPEPRNDMQQLAEMDRQRPGPAGDPDDRVFAEDWWSKVRPILEIHGYFRVRAELFHNFSLGRPDPPSQALWPMPADNQFTSNSVSYGPQLCTADEVDEGSDNPRDPLQNCKNNTQAGANLRFRLSPELHISDNLRILSQIDLLDNLVLGSTPSGYAVEPADSGGHAVIDRSGYVPIGFSETTQVPPSSNRNSFKDSIEVKRVWGEWETPIGELRFGRMPVHWGLGMLLHSGDGFDDDAQTTIDRIAFVTGLKPLDLFVLGSWDFVDEGPNSGRFDSFRHQPYDLAQLDDVDQYSLAVFRRKSPELTRLALAKGELVLNGGAYVFYRKQLLAHDLPGDCTEAAALGCEPQRLMESPTGYQRRGAEAWVPDLWLQLLYRKFRFEIEAVAVRGSIENLIETGGVDARDWKLRQYGVAGEIEQKLVEDRLRLSFKSGWASGDADVEGLAPPRTGLLDSGGDDTFSTFRFHPNYRVDLILHRNILTRVQGTYYFRPSVEYDFMREPNGQRFGGNFAAIWSRASEYMQTPGNRRDLGIELNGSLYFQSKDGALNDQPDQMGGFYTMLQYGVLFPLGGFDYLRDEQGPDPSTPQVLRWYLGVLF